MSEAPRYVSVGFVGDECVGTFVALETAMDYVRRKACEEHHNTASTWVPEANETMFSTTEVYLLYMGFMVDVADTDEQSVARVELVPLERRVSPGERRRS